MFDIWYNNMKPPSHGELLSFYERIHDHVLKAALSFSISESDKMVIEERHLLSAFKAVKYVEGKIPSAIAYIGATVQSNIADTVVSMIATIMPEPMSRSVLMRRVYKRLAGGAIEFQTIIDSLKEQNKIYETVNEKGTFYSIEKPDRFYGKYRV